MEVEHVGRMFTLKKLWW